MLFLTREWLYERLKRIKGLASVMITITHSSKNSQALVPTMKSISFILQSKLRIVIKILTMLFSTGIDNNDSKKQQEMFCEKLSKLVRKSSWNQQTSGAMGCSRNREKEKMKMIQAVSKLAI
jgi:hypothetical protein